MKAFNIQTEEIIEVYRAEELIKGVVFPITDEQEDGIIESLKNNGVVYIDNGEIHYSGQKEKDHYWDDDEKRWVFDQELKDARIRDEQVVMWEKIKERRSEAQQSGVFIKSIDKWVHTDAEAQRNYLFLKLVIENPEFDPPYWKSMDGTYFKMTLPVYQEIVLKAYNKAISDFSTADTHRKEMLKLEEPTSYDYNRWWSASYAESKM